MSSGDVVIETLTEKIQRQDRFIAELQAELQRARQASVDAMLGQLRLREAVLLYVGQDVDNFAQQIAENFGSFSTTRLYLPRYERQSAKQPTTA